MDLRRPSFRVHGRECMVCLIPRITVTHNLPKQFVHKWTVTRTVGHSKAISMLPLRICATLGSCPTQNQTPPHLVLIRHDGSRVHQSAALGLVDSGGQATGCIFLKGTCTSVDLIVPAHILDVHWVHTVFLFKTHTSHYLGPSAYFPK